MDEKADEKVDEKVSNVSMFRAVFIVAGALSMAGCAPPPEFGADTADDGNGDSMGDGGGAALDLTRLDRGAEGPCGYPTGGSKGYGTGVGKRFENSAQFPLSLCDGSSLEIGDFFCQRDDAYGEHNRGILINIGAGWCGPCQDETLEFPELYEEYHDKGIEIVQILFQDWVAQTPTKAFCSDWATGNWTAEGGGMQDVGIRLEYPVAIDQVSDWTSKYLADPESAAPVNILLDANGNIRWKLEGQKPDLAVLRTQFDLVIADPYGDD
ncbi:MAG: redoxin family protein [Nannocystaceae bacterium]|nr:redoxin family protein [Nannocystaceae bacterium]